METAVVVIIIALFIPSVMLHPWHRREPGDFVLNRSLLSERLSGALLMTFVVTWS